MAKTYRVGKLQFSYAKRADVLYISFGEPRPAVGEETEEGFILRFDEDTNELVGITIPFFKETFGMPAEIHIKKPKIDIEIPVEKLVA